MKIETDGRLKSPVFINAALKNQHLHDIVMKTTGKLKKGIRMQLKSLNDIVQYLETVQRSSYELIFDSVPGQTDLPDYHDCHVHKFWELKFRNRQGNRTGSR